MAFNRKRHEKYTHIHTNHLGKAIYSLKKTDNLKAEKDSRAQATRKKKLQVTLDIDYREKKKGRREGGRESQGLSERRSAELNLRHQSRAVEPGTKDRWHCSWQRALWLLAPLCNLTRCPEEMTCTIGEIK